MPDSMTEWGTEAMDLDALRFGNFSKLGEAVTDWEEMAKKIAELKKDAEDNLKGRADKAKWAGVNATVSREFVAKTAAEFADAHTQADSIAKILSDTRSELIDYRTQLNEALSRGAKNHLAVMDTGEGTFIVTGNARPDWAADPSGNEGAVEQKVIDGLRDEIGRILSKASESDSTAAKVLRLIVDQAKYGFSDAKYADRDSAAEAVANAERLAGLAKKPDEMTLDDIAEFNRVMAEYRDDPLFSERFVKELGAKGTLQFWADITHQHGGATESELEAMKSLQNNLSLTLATASFSDSDSMQAWKKDLLAETNTSFRPSNDWRPVGALGAQVISSLMRQGQYDTEFFDDYREKLFKADKAAGERDTGGLWSTGVEGIDLVFGDGHGRDPLGGLFDALSENPEAAAHAFTSKSDLDHMLATTLHTDRGTDLGHALETAVTGAPHGNTTYVAPPHSEEQVHIMANIMEAVAQPGGGAELVKEGIGESFGRMVASYMPEISRALGSDESGVVFISQGDAPNGLKVEDVARFLAAVAVDPAGRAGIVYGESIYTGSLLEAHLSDPSLFDGSRRQVTESIARNAGIVEGIVASSVADAEIARSVDGEDEYNKSLEEQGNFYKSLIAAGAGCGAIALVPATPAGAMVGAVGGGFMAGVAGMGVDRLMEGKELDGALDEAIYRTSHEFFGMRDSVNQQTQWSVQDALQRYDVDLGRDEASDMVRVAVNDGWSRSSDILDHAKERQSG
ncbi:hypothetical protein [Streptomyces sp. NPDC017230]|uniref:hypothetical protein n=1 Tax=unclassified Streptomyces TaxID=2593676 RepID=UPI0037ACC9FC